MSLQQMENITVSVSNIGGIDQTSVSLEPPVNVLVGKNATNRTSFLRALMGALGSDRVSLKGDAEEGSVEFSLEGETYTRTLRRTNGTVVMDGDPYLDDSEPADLFAFLLEMNEARQAVIRDEDLRDLIMRPVDTDAITDEIERLENEKTRLSNRLEELERVKKTVPELEQRRTTYESQLEEKQEALEEKQAEIDEIDADVQETKAERRELEEKLDELSDLRADLEGIRFQLETERESLESTRAEHDEVESELENLPEGVPRDQAEIESELSSLRERKRSLDSTVNRLQNLVQFNEEMIEGESELLGVLSDQSESDQTALTDQLVSDEHNGVCWTCGSRVDRSQLTETLEELRAIVNEKRKESASLRKSVRDLESERNEVEKHEQKRARLQNKLDRLASEIDRRGETIEQLEADKARKQDEIEAFESEIDSFESTEHDELLSLHKEANQLEFEIGQLEDDLEDVNREIAEKTKRIEEMDDLRARREEIQDELTDLRTKIDQLEQDAVESFNHHMNALLDTLGYENLERIWLERTERQVRQGRRKVTKSTFDLHVIRTTDSGASYEDSIEHLSESEREVTGLVVALAGYLVHEIYEEVPFMILDSLEAIDSDRIAKLIDYFEEYAPYIVVSLLPEDAAALDESYHRVTSI